MHTSLYVITALGSVVVTFALTSGCGSLPSDCQDRFACAVKDTGTGGTEGTSGTGGDAMMSSSMSTGGGGAGGAPSSSCVPSENKEPVGNDCGVFVSVAKGSENGEGTKASPLRLLSAAVEKAASLGKPVYACAESFLEPITVKGSVVIYGGLDCEKEWLYGAGKKTVLTSVADTIPFVVRKEAEIVKLFDVSIEAESASKSGGSSIATIVEGAKATFVRCDIIARDAKAGLAGEMPTDKIDPSGPQGPDDSKIRGLSGGDGECRVASVPTSSGGLPKENPLCPFDVSNSIGGAGGTGYVKYGTSGDVQPSGTAMTARGGIGQPIGGAWGGCGAVGNGENGAPGKQGADGEGARGEESLGKLDISGYTGVAGKDGARGAAGQGGGGGGGTKGYAAVIETGQMSCSGGGGGGGGVGGCGGFGGKGGKPGGSSIGIISLGAQLSFVETMIQLGKAGDGGDGGSGQFGAQGGNGGRGGTSVEGSNKYVPVGVVVNGCRGGAGGYGGNGGTGGGGRGGHAVGIAVAGTSVPQLLGMSVMGGSAGQGGEGVDPSHGGDGGARADVLAFP